MADIDELYGDLKAVNNAITPLIQRRQEILNDIAVAERIQMMRSKADTFAAHIAKIPSLSNPSSSLLHCMLVIRPCSRCLPERYFENTLAAIPDEIQQTKWSTAISLELCASLTQALAEDVDAFEVTCDSPNC